MKIKKTIGVCILLIAIIAILNITNRDKNNAQSILFFANVEALASGEYGAPSVPCNYKEGATCSVAIQTVDGYPGTLHVPNAYKQ